MTQKILWKITFLLCVLLTTCQENEVPDSRPQNTIPLIYPTLPKVAFVGQGSVHPEPGSNYNLTEFDGMISPKGDGSGGICVELNGWSVIEPDDQGLVMRDYLDRSILIVNDQVWQGDAVDFAYDSFMRQVNRKYDPDSEAWIALEENSIGPFHFCWGMELDIGTHTAEYKIRQTSGNELSYSWQFTISEPIPLRIDLQPK